MTKGRGKAYRRHLERTTQHKLQLLNGHIHSPKQSRDAVAVVLGPVLNQLNGGLEVVQESVDISQEDLDVASCLEELGDFHNLVSLDEACQDGPGKRTGTKYPQ